VEKLAVWEEQKRLLDEALNRLEQEKNNAARSERIIDEVNTRLAADNLLQKELSGRLTELPEISRKLELAEIESTRRLEEQRNFREKIAILKERIKQLEELEKRGIEKHRSLDEATEKENLYRQLTTIFGKKGLQAMLIETALPEIEAEANRLLARMTDGRMNLTFETQQPTKKGDISETLEIKIADELGTRNYEMFSGGEAFRIDFSIRVALSRLLARRAGAPLPTLIIDEGFGTQDADGIEKLKEAINSVQDDFQKILVITHIDELKDAFPTRIDVVKKAEGSTIEIS
jgi:exonuclease SbcC